MALGDIRDALGIGRVVWIDDVFGDPAIDLAILAKEHPEIVENFPDLAPAFALQGYGDVDAALTEAIENMEELRREELRNKLLQEDAEQAPANELEEGTVQAACNQLGVAVEDRWSFQQADATLAIGNGDDESVAYVIDLKEGGGRGQRGLDILRQLRAKKSKGVAFILTHEAAIDGEAALEQELAAVIQADLDPNTGLAPPITVISKGRLTEENANLEAAFAIALKRAGLRRTLYQVLFCASDRASMAYRSTASSLLSIEPERLEQFVYERGRAEGVSELSVVERALTAGASSEIRSFFATDEVVLGAMQALRSLESIPLDNKLLDAGPVLASLRNSEVWEDGKIVNAAFTPLANGDVFCFDGGDPKAPNSPRLFVLVGQPCDIMLRADGKRVSDMAMLVPLTALNDDGSPVPDANEEIGDDSNKTPELPFRLKGKKFKLNLRSMAYVRLNVLDLACLRADGCVRVDAGHGAPAALLAGVRTIYGNRTGAADASLALPVPAIGQPGERLPIDDRLLLTMSDVSPWDRIRLGARLAPYAPSHGGNQTHLPDRVTWFLRREGRVRAPYSAFLLERTLRTLGRRAFDTDYAN